MKEKPNPIQKNPLRVVQDVLHEAQTSQDAQHRRVEGAGLSPQMAELRLFQVERIAQTYRDFAAQPQYALVMQFFQNDLYAPRDFSQRDHDAQRVHDFLKKFMPAEMLKLASDAIELTRLSYTLDEAMLRVLVEQMRWKTGVTLALYAEAYRRCNNVPLREKQIELLVTVMKDSADTARMPLTGVALKLAKGPAHAAGWHELFAFLERGNQAFAKVKHPEKFREAIEERESEIMHRIMARNPDPFRLD